MNFEQQDEVIEVANSIFDSLHNDGAFIPLVEKKRGRTIEISDEKKVSCSVGISFFDKQHGDAAFEIALKQADDALYFIKKSGKCRYEISRFLFLGCCFDQLSLVEAK